MIVSGHTTLTALQESESYTIRCSTGSVIPVDAEGHPSAGTVEASFWKFDEASGKTVAVTAERASAYFFNEAGGTKDRTVRGSHTLDLTPMLGDSQVSFVRVILYADDAGTRSLRSADFTLAYPTAVAQWRIECSTGNTIPVGKDGKPAGSVKAVAKRAGADGAFSRQAVDKLTATAYAGSAPVTYAVAEGADEIELRGLLTSAAYSFVRVEASEGGKAVAQADFALSFPTAFPLALEANGTAGPLMFDAYGSFQGGALTVRLVRGAQAVAGRAQMVAWYDTGDTAQTGFLDVPAAGRDFLPELSGMREYALSHVVFRFHEQDEAEADAREQRFEVSYATPVTFFRRDAWSAGNSYKNGEVLLLTRTTDGGQEVSEVYRWQYPVGGNTDADPWTYFSSGAKPAYWAQHESWPLLFTESLIAPFALLGGAVFFGDYMMSQQGVDKSGAASSDYRSFPEGFTPTTLLNFKTGVSSFREIRALGGLIGPLEIAEDALRAQGFEIGENEITFTFGDIKMVLSGKDSGRFLTLYTSGRDYIRIGTDENGGMVRIGGDGSGFTLTSTGIKGDQSDFSLKYDGLYYQDSNGQEHKVGVDSSGVLRCMEW